MSVNRKETLHLIKEMLKGGTPDWYRFPHHYKAMVDEWHKQARENLLAECSAYKVDDQDLLAKVAERRVNMMRSAAFMKKLRTAGVRCFSHSSQLNDGTASLFAVIKQGMDAQPICSIQVPMMWEWSTLRIDPATDLPSGFRDIGWRSAVKCLIVQGALTEAHAHEIFGEPRNTRVSRVYRRILFDHRNDRRQNAA
jgi:hypothetical protein